MASILSKLPADLQHLIWMKYYDGRVLQEFAERRHELMEKYYGNGDDFAVPEIEYLYTKRVNYPTYMNLPSNTLSAFRFYRFSEYETSFEYYVNHGKSYYDFEWWASRRQKLSFFFG